MDYPSFSLQGQVVLLTGASQGIGRGLAKALAHAGATVVATARNLDALMELVQEITDEGGHAEGFGLDVRNVTHVYGVMEAVRQRFGRIDVLVNNAGIGANHPAVDVTEADWDA